jgi:hypothetical protein
LGGKSLASLTLRRLPFQRASSRLVRLCGVYEMTILKISDYDFAAEKQSEHFVCCRMFTEQFDEFPGGKT